MSQLGRIGGQVLTDNLLRAGVDLAFETDLLYLDVTNNKIGVRDSTPIYDLDVNSNITTNIGTVINQATIDDIVITAPGTISSIVAPINVVANSIIFHDRLITSFLEFDDNFIGSFSNSNIILNPNGSGTVEIISSTNITGILTISGNTIGSGNFQFNGNIIIGDDSADTLAITPDLTQDIVPGVTGVYNFGAADKRFSNAYLNIVDIFTGLTTGNITISSSSNVSVASGNLSIIISGATPTASFNENIETSGIKINGNSIQSLSNQNIIFSPNGSGSINLEAETDILGNLAVTGNITMLGNLTGLSTLILGDQTIDTVTVNTDFAQSIIPGDDVTFAMGADAGDSSPRRWAEVYSPDWTNITTGAWPGSGLAPQTATISSQMTLDGIINKISAIQSNDDLFLNPYTGITRIENIRLQLNDITNLSNTALTVAGTGTGYYLFAGNNGMVIPAGTTAERRATPDIGETRWNTELDYIECYDGTVWNVSIGGGLEVTVASILDINYAYTLMLG